MSKTTLTTSKVKKQSNLSTFQLGTDTNNYFKSLSKTDYNNFERVPPPKPIIQKEEGVHLGDEPKQHHFVTTTMERFTNCEENPKNRVTYKNRGLNRFNPITG